MQIAFELDCLNKVYPNGREAIKNLSLKSYFGDFVGLIGPNGAGKSTLIHLLSKVIRPTSGNICYSKKLQDNKIAWVSQDVTIDWYLSVKDNVRLGARLGGATFQESAALADEALEAVDLQDVAREFCDTLSGGQQRRVQIARALAHNSELIILDEPTTGLDVKRSTKLMDILKKKAESGAIVIVSSHDLGLIEDYVQKIWCLSKGEIIADHSQQEFIDLYCGKNIINITFQGEVNSCLKDILLPYNVKFINSNIMKLEVPKTYILGDLLQKISPFLSIVGLTTSNMFLKDAYTRIHNKNEG